MSRCCANTCPQVQALSFCSKHNQSCSEADPEADVSLPNGSSPEEDHIQGLPVQPALRLSKTRVLTEVNELEVVHAQLVDVPGGPTLADAMVLAIHTEVLEALLQCWVGLKACMTALRSLGLEPTHVCKSRFPWFLPYIQKFLKHCCRVGLASKPA